MLTNKLSSKMKVITYPMSVTKKPHKNLDKHKHITIFAFYGECKIYKNSINVMHILCDIKKKK